ncbi:ComEC/Rec2 family competence protein [Aliiroseovarius halocynthiae]|uniref:ComEC/Rec2 family competence protein n=1 Tax=Aliiroseovarius halocynthiae TaxID=985055 RepID=UPI00163D470D|nr:ComEC/Rec2 family competence protein [Aliiroseovarius halocynthiae]
MKLLSRIEEERGRFLIWAPLFFGTGIGLYFAQPREPNIVTYTALALLVAICAGLAWRWPWGAGPLLHAMIFVSLGFGVAGARANWVAAPVLDFRYYGPIEGRIVAMDRSQSDAVRLTLDQVRLSDVNPLKLPDRVRVSLHGEQGFLTPAIGQRIALTGHLSGPNGPVEPGGFDFQRMAWFRGIGAVGYTRSPALLLSRPTGELSLAVGRLRQTIANRVRAVLPGESGSFAATITTGDRSSMDRATIEALRGSNLAHLLAISGLHMGLLTGFVFQAMRILLGLWPRVALNIPVKKLAAVTAIGAGIFYLALSGGAVATTRAFIMVTTMFVAILFDRRALTLRAVAMAAMIVLILTPEALVEPGFQMSFAATTALVAVFSWIRERGRDGSARQLPGWARGVVTVVISSAVAGLATAPIGAAHFNQVSHYGLVANLLSVPVMGAVIMPLAVLAALLSIIRLEFVALWMMDWPIRWILWVAETVSSLDGAVGKVPAPPGFVLPLLGATGIVFVLLRGKEKLVVLLPSVIALAGWALVERPAVLISSSGGLIGVMFSDGRVMSKARGEGFAARSWLENDGDAATQQTAFERAGFGGQRGQLKVDLPGLSIMHLSGRGAEDRLGDACAKVDVVVLAAWREGALPTGCSVLDRKYLTKTGAVAVHLAPKGWYITPSRTEGISRLWTR